MTTWPSFQVIFLHLIGARQLNLPKEAKLHMASRPVMYIGAEASPPHMSATNSSKCSRFHGSFTFFTRVPICLLAALNTVEENTPSVGDGWPAKMCCCLIVAEIILITAKDFFSTACQFRYMAYIRSVHGTGLIGGTLAWHHFTKLFQCLAYCSLVLGAQASSMPVASDAAA